MIWELQAALTRRLLLWSAVSVAAGALLLLFGDPFWRGFGVQAVAWGAIDLKFRNNTPHGVLIEAKVTPSTPSSQGVVRVRMWSTKVWDIQAVTGERRNFTPPQTRTLSGPDCMPNTGYAGFDITVKRVFRKPGQRKVERTEDFNTTYTPSDTVVCRKAGDDD